MIILRKSILVSFKGKILYNPKTFPNGANGPTNASLPADIIFVAVVSASNNGNKASGGSIPNAFKAVKAAGKCAFTSNIAWGAVIGIANRGI